MNDYENICESFREICSGVSQQPLISYFFDEDILKDTSLSFKEYLRAYVKNMGSFWKHYCCSIPYLAEEQARVGHSLLKFATGRDKLLFYEPKAADSTDGRTLAEKAGGKVFSFCNVGKMRENYNDFRLLNTTPNAIPIIGNFEDIGMGYLGKEYPALKEGLDVIYCNVTFQFGPGLRKYQIMNLKKMMKNKGLFFCLEKVFLDNQFKYEQNELRNRIEYKERYFSSSQLDWKEESVIKSMCEYQVSKNELVTALKYNFEHVYLIWNSFNFFEFVASDCLDTIESFISSLERICIPSDFVIDELGRC